RASHVWTIASEYNTEIADHESLGRDWLVRGAPMRQRRSGPSSNYGGKRHILRPCPTRRVLNFRCDLGFSYSRPDCPPCDLEHACTQQHRGAETPNFFRILHHACLLDQRWCLAQTESRREYSRQPLSPSDRQVLAFNAHHRPAQVAPPIGVSGHPRGRRDQWCFATNHYL